MVRSLVGAGSGCLRVRIGASGAWIGLCLLAGVPAMAAEVPVPDWRQQALDAARAGIAAPAALGRADGFEPAAAWGVSARLYLGGSVVAYEAALGGSLDEAARRAGARIAASAPAQTTAEGRLYLEVEGPGPDGHLVEYRGKALRIVGDVTVVESVDRARILATVREQREYLLRQIDPDYKAFFKVYSARQDKAQDLLRVTYTASALWTLLQMQDLEPDPRIAALIEPIASFLLSMQVSKGEHAGAFHYAIDRRDGAKRDRFVVGTVSKTIFTLLELHRRGGDARYLESARRAGDWLLTRVDSKGRVSAETLRKLSTGEWATEVKHSVLYSSETLSALSQLARVTGERKYRRAATRIAERLLAQGEASGHYYGDDYREPNTISTSWVSMALIEYTRVVRDRRAEQALLTAAHQVVSRQIDVPPKLLDHGRYYDTWATSGNGWMNEVLVPVYRRCVETGQPRCEEFRGAMDRSARWLVQNTYSPENSYHIPNPERARGGAIRNSAVEAVRTDAVCHAANSLIGMLQLPAH